MGEYVVAFLLKNPVSNETGFFVLLQQPVQPALGSVALASPVRLMPRVFCLGLLNEQPRFVFAYGTTTQYLSLQEILRSSSNFLFELSINFLI